MTKTSHFIIDLIRHGEPEGGRKFRGSLDEPLSENGWRQLNAATENLKWDKVVSSPLIRCADFAKQLSDQTQTPVVINKGFREISFGEWEGLTPEQIEHEHPADIQRFWNDPTQYFPAGGEGIVPFQQRIGQAWQSLLNETQTTSTLLVCHGGVIRAVLCELLAIPPQRFWSLDVTYASITRIEVKREQAQTRSRLISHAAPIRHTHITKPN